MNIEDKIRKFIINEVRTVKLDKRKAKGVTVFQYWHACPVCNYQYLTEEVKLCGKCGTKIEFYGEVNYK